MSRFRGRPNDEAERIDGGRLELPGTSSRCIDRSRTMEWTGVVRGDVGRGDVALLGEIGDAEVVVKLFGLRWRRLDAAEEFQEGEL